MGNNFQMNDKMNDKMQVWNAYNLAFWAGFKQKLSNYQKSVKWIIRKYPYNIVFIPSKNIYLTLYIFDKSVIALDLFFMEKTEYFRTVY